MSNETPILSDPTLKGEAWKAALLSALVIPGAGQIYNRQWVKGLFIAVLFLVASLSVLVPITYILIVYYIHLGSDSPEQAIKPLQMIYKMMIQLITLTIVSIVLYIYSIVDAYRHRIRSGSQSS